MVNQSYGVLSLYCHCIVTVLSLHCYCDDVDGVVVVDVDGDDVVDGVVVVVGWCRSKLPIIMLRRLHPIDLSYKMHGWKDESK